MTDAGTGHLVARGVSRTFGPFVAVQDVDLEMHGGEVLGLIGPNGGGKSTLLLLLAGLLEPTAGTITLDGVPTQHLARQAAGAIGLITTAAGLYPLLTGRENLHFFGGLNGLPPDDVDARTLQWMEQLDMTDALDKPAGAASAGMQQKISLARALLLRPKLLLLDEPTANLDPVSTRHIHEAIADQAQRGVGVVLCTHDLHAAEHICDRVGVMNRSLLAVEALDGPRGAPPEGALHRLYARALQ